MPEKRTVVCAWFFIVLGILVFVYHSILILNNPHYFWAPAIDQKTFGSIALNFLDGLGPRFDALEPYQFSSEIKTLDCYYFSFLHPLLIAGLMKLTNSRSFYPILFSTALYMALLIPLTWLTLRKIVSPAVAFFGALFISLSPIFITLGPSGQSEPLMLLELILILYLILKKGNPIFISLLAGLMAGAMNVTRPTGMVLAPAFLYIFWKMRGLRGLLFFATGFALVTAWGNALMVESPLQYSRLAYPVIGSQEFGGLSALDYTFEPKSPIATNLTHWRPIIQKTLQFSFQFLNKLPDFWGDLWVFVPPLFLILWRRRRMWSVFLILIFSISTLSVVGFFPPSPRVNIHLQPIVMGLTFLYLQLLSKSLSKWLWIRACVFALPLALLLSERLSGNGGRLVIEVIFATVLVLGYFSNSFHRKVRRFRPTMALTFVLAVFLLSFNSHLKAVHRWLKPAELYPFQQSMMALRSSIPANSIILSDDIRDITWFSRLRGVYLPRNFFDFARYLKTFNEKKFVVLVEPPSEEFRATLLAAGFHEWSLGLPSLIVFGESNQK